MATISQAVININKRTEKMVRGTIIGCASRIIKRTPVGNPELWLFNNNGVYVDYLAYKDPPEGYVGGTLRGNWQPSIGQPVTTEIDRIDKTGQTVTADIRREGQRLNIGAVFYMTNNLPYAARIEFDGWSTQASAGMMRIEVIETAAAIRANRMKD
jgi:hypothetical protein